MVGANQTVSVSGTARQVLAGVDKERLRHNDVVLQILRSSFDPVGRMELHCIQLKTRVRKAGESLSTLADDIRRLVDRVFHDIPLESREKLARDCFIDALTDGEMRTRILQMRTTTIQEAMEVAIELEALSKAERERTESSDPAFQEGEVVLLATSVRTKGKCPKFQPRWDGPYVITARLGDVNVRLQKGSTCQPVVVHVDRVKRFNGDYDKSWWTDRHGNDSPHEQSRGRLRRPPDRYGDWTS